MNVTLLGTGTSTGLPVIGCSCRVCTSEDVRDKRTRCSCWIEGNGVSIIIGTGPDFRNQALREHVNRVDAVLFTHHHFDHVVGLDDLRPYFFDNEHPIPCYARKNTAEVLRKSFRYIFSERNYPGIPNLKLKEIKRVFDVKSRYEPCAGLHVLPVEVYHGDLLMFGYRIGNFAYLTDTNRIPEHSFDLLKGLDVLVINALRHRPHPAHFTFAQAVEAAQRIGARETVFTHMTHNVLHEEENARLPAGISLGYDGLKLVNDGS